ncbi:hypothetical protein KUTeg_005792 [Tegillarca granosa]|uniref:Uncharacterized protein n=1 Tax=Tegillarca granosa TaxID=220873 RepID=A0ABQ9FH53_TEGGR|nr:hypothetical protein KUTeg_005792 [Tegillarca granosa]
MASKNGTVSDKLQHLAHSMVNHLVSSRSDNTIKNYFSAFKKWQTFANSENLKAIPAEPIHVALFLTDLMNNGKSVNVIQYVVYGSKWVHKLRGVSDPTNNHYVHNLVESAKRHKSVQKTKKCVIPSKKIIELCNKYRDTTDILIFRDLCIILLCYADFFAISGKREKRTSIDRGSEILISEGVTSYEHVQETVVSRLKEVCGNLNIGLHSMRASWASMVARSHVNERCWKRHGRWRSDISKDSYIEDSIEKRLEVTREIHL